MFNFDDFPVVYFVLGYALAGGIVLLFFFRKNLPLFIVLFPVLSALLVIYMRMPVLVFNREINPDESQMIAHALTLRHDPVYWQSVDGTTIGPLDNYVLLLPSLFGLPFDYTSARWVGLLCVLGSLWFFYKSVRNFFDAYTAQSALLPPLFLAAFGQEPDFVHYSSEQLPVLLLNIGLWLLSTLFVVSRQSLRGHVKPGRLLFWLGIVLGMSLFAKIQVVPQAAVLGIFALVVVHQPKTLLKNAGLLVVGGILPLLLVVSWAAAYGVMDDFWNFYVRGNLIYAGGSSIIDAMLRIPLFFAKSLDFLLFLGGIGLVAFLGFFQKDKGILKPGRLTVFIIFWVLAALYAATKSGNDFVHYLNLCIYPLALCGAIFVHKMSRNKPFIQIASLLTLLPFAGSFGLQVLKHQPINAYVSTDDHRVPLSEVSKLILQHARSTDRLVVWGWMCKYHVETQMPQGTAENHSERCIYPHPMREIYYQRYLADLRRTRPKVFVDAVPNSLWLNDRLTQGHDAFPELKHFIARHYHFVGEVEQTRVYLKNNE